MRAASWLWHDWAWCCASVDAHRAREPGAREGAHQQPGSTVHAAPCTALLISSAQLCMSRQSTRLVHAAGMLHPSGRWRITDKGRKRAVAAAPPGTQITTASACRHAGMLVRPAHGITWLRNDRNHVWRLHMKLKLDCHASPHVARSCCQDAAACARTHHTACTPQMRIGLSLHSLDFACLPMRVLPCREIQPRLSRAALTASQTILHAV